MPAQLRGVWARATWKHCPVLRGALVSAGGGVHGAAAPSCPAKYGGAEEKGVGSAWCLGCWSLFKGEGERPEKVVVTDAVAEAPSLPSVLPHLWYHLTNGGIIL